MALLTDAQALARCPEGGDDLESFNIAIEAASASAIAILGYDPTLATTTERYSGLGSRALIVNRSPIISVGAISLTTGDPANPWVFDPSTIDHDGDRMILLRDNCFPRGVKNVAVTYTAGLATPPFLVVQAVGIILAAMWDARDVDQNATSESFNGVLSQGWWQSGPGAVPPQAMSLLLRCANTMNMG